MWLRWPQRVLAVGMPIGLLTYLQGLCYSSRYSAGRFDDANVVESESRWSTTVFPLLPLGVCSLREADCTTSRFVLRKAANHAMIRSGGGRPIEVVSQPPPPAYRYRSPT